MLSVFTTKITNQITRTFPEISREKAEQIDYGLYMLFSDIAKILALIVISAILNIMVYTIVAILVFGILRVFLGGIHAKNQIECIIMYPIFIFGCVYLSYLHSIGDYKYVMQIVSLILALKYGPADLPCKPIGSKKLRKRLKILGVGALLLLLVISFFIPTIYSNIITITTLLVTSLLTPAVYKITGNTKSNIL